MFNRTQSKAEAWVANNGGAMAGTPAEAAVGNEVVFACVGNDDDVRAVTIGPDGAFATMQPGSVFVDHTTASATVARELSTAAEQCGLFFIDAPVSGGQAGAENGALTVMCGGDLGAFSTVEPVIRSFANAVTRIGPSGAGQLTKMVNQICIAGVVQGLAEAVNFAQHAGLDPELVISTISKGAAQSWQMENRAATMANGEFNFGFAVEWMRKDLGIVLDEANVNGSHLPLTALVDQFYKQIIARGGQRWDTSSLIDLLRHP